MSDLEKGVGNIKAVLWTVTIVLPLLEALVGAGRSVRDAIRRMKGQKTSVQLAIEKHVTECAEKVAQDLVEQLKNGQRLPDELKEKVMRGEI